MQDTCIVSPMSFFAKSAGFDKDHNMPSLGEVLFSLIIDFEYSQEGNAIFHEV